jgi:hypothetical protein
MTILELAAKMFEYHAALTSQGFKPTEAMQLVIAHQTKLLENDLIERLQRKGDQPWE